MSPTTLKVIDLQELVLMSRHLRHKLESWSEIVRRDPCCYCGAPSETVEHAIPRGAGGAVGAVNMVGACTSCNNERGSAPLLLFLLWRQLQPGVPFHAWASRYRYQIVRQPLLMRSVLTASIGERLHYGERR